MTEDVNVVAGKLATSGALTIADVDQGQSNFAVQAATAGSNGYGTFTLAANGNWTYSATNSQTAIQQLGAGQSITDSFTAVSSDGTASQLVTVTINGTNDAPVLTPIGPTLTTITEDQTTNVTDPGQTVLSFIGTSISDVDTGAIKGIAITGLSSTDGTWQYSTDGGTTWTAIGAVTNASALLLDATSKVQFLPDSNDGGTDTITYRAWDETSGAVGTKVDTSTSGTSTAFSTATDTATITVMSINDAPVATIIPTSYSATEQQTLNLKNSGMSVSDVDSRGAVETATLSVTEGTLTVTAGTSGTTVTNSGSNSVTISGTLAQINALLNTNGTSTVSYIDNTYSPSPSAALTLLINDNGHSGSGGALTGSDTATINIAPIVSACTYKTFNNSNQQTNQTEIDNNGGSVRITLTFSGPVHFTGGNPTLTVADGDDTPPNNDTDLANYNSSLSNPSQGVLVFTYSPSGDDQTHALAIIAVNGTIRDASNNIVNTAAFIGVLTNHVHTDNTTVQEHLGLNEPAAPAGVAGDPINLALTDLSGGRVARSR